MLGASPSRFARVRSAASVSSPKSVSSFARPPRRRFAPP
ncbi:hypothetical protein C884_01220 [Kocuria palustris PEL]|uniref:Uncharacterized protein n=1 Tax=Kocuria palustris PEL TaxID=1236550 RepID=M2YBF9_9MICC|nr:hypothetical protein C884_01220 [Kocuria palustris PEL]